MNIVFIVFIVIIVFIVFNEFIVFKLLLQLIKKLDNSWGAGHNINYRGRSTINKSGRMLPPVRLLFRCSLKT